ncbi:zinc finger protein (plasmid) [Paraburkholderia caribensis MBA4]|uniref:Zinc finger protein n=1 Tax=Paraburkholderia caribensis MBA4 TaxID=1323664 RepID=A0A0P0RPP2_9BURK|nr:zinc finger protein [Paraburkholderia caribensis MBA4]
MLDRGSARRETPRRPGCIRECARNPRTVDWLRFSGLVPRIRLTDPYAALSFDPDLHMPLFARGDAIGRPLPPPKRFTRYLPISLRAPSRRPTSYRPAF